MYVVTWIMLMKSIQKWEGRGNDLIVIKQINTIIDQCNLARNH